jgi:hypothetical protein
MKKLLVFMFSILTEQLCAQHPNILISNTGKPNETCIAIHPHNSDILVAGANLHFAYRSTDGGKSWRQQVLQSSYGVWGDPVVMADTNGSFYFFHLSNPDSGNWIDRIVCQKSVDSGSTWSNGTYFGLAGSKAQDKHWVAIDNSTNTIYVTWTQFDEYGSALTSDSSNILFSKSTDGGLSWTPAKRINQKAGDCIDSSLTTEGAVPTVGPNGEIYVAWAGPEGLVFDRSIDGGQTWLSKDIQIDSMKAGWSFNVPGISRCNGLPVTVCDISQSPFRGTIYVNWTDQRNGSDNTDVFIAKSTDGGNTWSKPIKINDDTSGKHQFMSWLTIDAENGHLYAVFYDRRNYSDNRTDVYLAHSADGGISWVNERISEKPFLPVSSVFFGDYTHLVARGGMVRPIWTRMDDGQTSIWTALVNKRQQTLYIAPAKSSGDTSKYPNPSDDAVFVSFKNRRAGKVSVHLLDERGSAITTIVEQRDYPAGKYVESFYPATENLKAGVYYWRIQTSTGEEQKRWIYQP